MGCTLDPTGGPLSLRPLEESLTFPNTGSAPAAAAAAAAVIHHRRRSSSFVVTLHATTRAATRDRNSSVVAVTTDRTRQVDVDMLKDRGQDAR